MPISKLISWISPRHQTGEHMSYDAVFKGTSNIPRNSGAVFLPGVKLVEGDRDTYFKDVFAGAVF